MCPSYRLFSFTLSAAMAGAALLTLHGSAWADDTPVAPESECVRLDAEIARADQALQAAQDQQRSAWKAMVPIAMLARHVKARSSGEQAGEKLDALRAQHARHGCASRDV